MQENNIKRNGEILEKLLSDIDNVCNLMSYPEKGGEETEAEYIRLFVTDFDSPVISLLASSYLKDLPTEQVLQYLKGLYEAAGLTPNPDEALREDHFLVCFDFLYLLLNAQLDKKLIKNFSFNFIFPFLPVPQLIRDKTKHGRFLKAADKLDEFFTLFEEWLN